MRFMTKHFGEIELGEEKIINFDNGIMGFEDYKRYTILFDIESGEKPVISWLQSIEEPGLAIPVINPLYVREDYNPTVEDELLISLGELNDENIIVLLSITVPSDITKMTSNLKAPFIINSDTRKGCQVIVENSDYPVKYNVYESLEKIKKTKGEK
ncbi:flagellar assembly factor FliW [Mobilisporobacter senegalensis]|uniref:Flagellar assembly factor FliW n=1 Tax=Mobilisporobacter senegalensis TaxID=1329262 RepID=A0A3N1XZ88_9FIRM|nr:flagellar assembly protein FliW [Mobilisporobacter senegalensis]ROR31551.1 flagellar assembly factor FliW [Mobilisporobacter senegalensis]